MKVMTYREALHQSMDRALKNHKKTIVYGLCVSDYTGIFGTTLGLTEKYGKERVFETPLSEDTMTGFAVGAALNGLYPIHVHMRADFMALAMNQLINSVAKYKYMYGGSFEIPIMVRAVIGRSWGQGAQHTQSFQARLSHIPGLTVVMPSCSQSVLETYDYAVSKYKAPIISFEHRLLYDYSFKIPDTGGSRPGNPLTSFTVRKGKDVTILASSFMVIEALNAAKYVKENEGLDVEVIDLHCLTNINRQLILNSIRKTRKLIIADTSWASFGVPAEISRMILKESNALLKMPMEDICTAPSPCPTTKALERYFYPDMGTVVDAIYKLACGKAKHGKRLPTSEQLRKLYKEFRGPF